MPAIQFIAVIPTPKVREEILHGFAAAEKENPPPAGRAVRACAALDFRCKAGL